MLGLRGITVCVNYTSTLNITLVRNMRHLAECLVVTSPEDVETHSLVNSVPGARLFITDAFTRHGARFNKGLALEEGFDKLGRRGWILIHDADILLPDSIPWDSFRADCINGCRRKLVDNPSLWSEDLDWGKLPIMRDGAPVGFFQLFHADDVSICDKRPWYDVSFAHAGGGDAYFITHWTPAKRRVLPFDVLHLGQRDQNWFGVNPEAREIMAAFVVRNGWSRPRLKVNPSDGQQVQEIKDRVDVPGYEPSQFELPFVRRAKSRSSSRT